MLTDDEIERRATALRKELGLDKQLRLDLMTVIHKAKGKFKRFDYLRVPDRGMPDAEAQFDSETGVISMRESVFQGMQNGNERARMTVAHEMGHFALKHAGVRNRAMQPGAAEKYLASVRSAEREAMRFAAAFLAPADLIGPHDNAHEIALRFGLSLQAAEIRRCEVEEMRNRGARQKRQLPENVINYLKEARRRGLPIKTEID
ncbi:ImmA/IrrE family metallo-endopeptidase [Bosea sp. NPDC003192]|uniref:ImmA/IrrE family metallo-endopeptidase n=1 Tax=Bosea sp. NPDC003192 TaxID=3390551 RepID=UPI003D004BB3